MSVIAVLRPKDNPAISFIRDVYRIVKHSGGCHLTVRRAKDSQADIKCFISSSDYLIACIAINRGEGEPKLKEFPSTREGQEKAVEALQNAVDDKNKQTKPLFQRGPRRVEVSVCYRTSTTGREWSGVVVNADGASDPVSPRFNIRDWRGTEARPTLSAIPHEIRLSEVYILKVALLYESCGEAQDIQTFAPTADASILALRHLRHVFGQISEDSKRRARTWNHNPIMSPASTGTVHSTKVSVLEPFTHYRVAGDQEGIETFRKQMENIEAGRRLVSLPGTTESEIKGESRVPVEGEVVPPAYGWAEDW